jgi:L-aspartate oxidase
MPRDIQYDYIIIGSGIAGLYTALLAREYGTVLIVTKGSIEDCNTQYAQGGIAAPVGESDSAELHMEDTLKAGADLCEEDAVRVLTNEASNRIADLIQLGVPFDTMQGEIALAREGAHSVPRVLHAGGDSTGRHIELTLVGLARMSRVQVLEYCLATDILIENGRAIGVRTLDTRLGLDKEFYGRFIVLASGGAGRLFRYTTNQEVATGDGVALAHRAGARIADMEFFQFHPTALHLSGAPPFLISEAVRGEGAILRNLLGESFMSEYHSDGELAPRDVVARAILSEMRRTEAGHVLLDITHLPQNRVAARFPNIYRFCLDHGINMSTTPIPVAPAAHYMMGGVQTTSWGESSIPGLYACGEVACVGVHGANRLASNSLLDTIVFGKRVVEQTQGNGTSEKVSWRQFNMALPDRKNVAGHGMPSLSLTTLQNEMWEKVGVVRNAEGLASTAETLAYWECQMAKATDRPSHELANLVLLGRLVTEAALAREESRGAHYRTDFPDISEDWQRHIVLSKS